MVKKILAVAVILSVVGLISADPIYPNITVYDKDGYMGGGQGGEDNETEPGCDNSQKWDLEAFLLKGNKLSMVGGYNFKEGQVGWNPALQSNYNYKSGNIFIDVKGKNGPSKWDYAIVMNFSGATQNSDGSWSVGYDLKQVTSDNFKNGYISANENDPESAPWRLGTGNGVTIESGTFTFRKLTIDECKALGLNPNQTHWTVEGFDLAFLDGQGDFDVKFTMECGNDNLVGSSKIALPEPGTLSMLIMGSLCMAGFWALRRKKEE